MKLCHSFPTVSDSFKNDHSTASCLEKAVHLLPAAYKTFTKGGRVACPQILYVIKFASSDPEKALLQEKVPRYF